MSRFTSSAEAVERAFYAAMADGDLERMMSLWVDDDSAVCNHPGGPRLVGPDAIRESFRDMFTGGGVKIATAAVRAWRRADVAVHSLIERIAVHGRGGAQVVEVVATNVFVRTTGGWRILVHHAGVSDGDEVDADDEDGDEDDAPVRAADDAPARGWGPSRPGTDSGPDDADDDPDPARPPPGRLH